MTNKLLDILNLNTVELEHNLLKSSVLGKGTPQEVSDRREKFVQNLIGSYFPSPHKIWKGNIVDIHGNTSQSIDCLVISPSHPHTINIDDSMPSIIFADGVDLAIEIKPKLDSKSEIERALIQIQSVKKLRRIKHNSLATIQSEEKIETLKTVPSCIFSFETYKDINTLLQKITDFYIENEIPRIEQFDLIFINGSSLIFNYKASSYFHSQVNLQMDRGLYYLDDTSKVLGAYLFFMLSFPTSQIPLQENYFKAYLHKILFQNDDDYITFKQNMQLNSRLRESNI